MRRKHLLLTSLLAMCLLMISAAPAIAAFGLTGLDVTYTNENGSAATQAGSHPFVMETSLGVNTFTDSEGGQHPEGEIKDLAITQIPGFVGNQTAIPRCSAVDFHTRSEGLPACPDSSAVGFAAVQAEFEVITIQQSNLFIHVPVYNLEPPPGVAAELGFVVLNVPVTVDVNVSESPPYDSRCQAPKYSPGNPLLQIPGDPVGQPGEPRSRLLARQMPRWSGPCLNA